MILRYTLSQDFHNDDHGSNKICRQLNARLSVPQERKYAKSPNPARRRAPARGLPSFGKPISADVLRTLTRFSGGFAVMPARCHCPLPQKIYISQKKTCRDQSLRGQNPPTYHTHSTINKVVCKVAVDAYVRSDAWRSDLGRRQAILLSACLKLSQKREIGRRLPSSLLHLMPCEVVHYSNSLPALRAGWCVHM